MKFLVDLRRLDDNNPDLRELDKSLKDLLRSWFDVGFLDLVRVSWNTSAIFYSITNAQADSAGVA